RRCHRREGTGRQLVDPRSLEGQDGTGGPHFPRAVDGSDRPAEAGVQAGAKVPGIGGSSALDAGFPAETMRQADASRSPLSRPSIDLPPTDYNARVEHMCENLWCGVLRTRTETVPARYLAPAWRCQELPTAGGAV